MRWKTLALAIGLGFAGLVGLFVLIPSQSERVGLMIRDGAQFQANTVNQQLLATAPFSPVLLYRAYLLRSEAGDIDGATQAAQRLVTATDGAIEATRILAQHYFDIGAMDARLDVLLAADPAQLTDEEREQLLGGLRYAARYADERAALARLARADLLSTSQSGRFGMLLAAGEEYRQAIVHLAEYDAGSEEPAIYERLTLLALLLNQRATDEARQRAERWQTLWDDPQLTDAIHDAFRSVGQIWR